MKELNNKLIILGSGGHSKVVIDILLQNNEYEIVGLIDNNVGDRTLDIPVIGTDKDLDIMFKDGIKNAFVAIGNNSIRRALIIKLKNIGFNIINVISEDSVVSKSVKLGNGILIMPGAIINACSQIGDGCIINTRSSIDHDCIISEYTHIAPGSTIAGSVKIGLECFLGVGSKIIDGIEIKDKTTIGAGSTVIKSMEGNSIIVGTPGKIIKKKDIKES